MNSRYIVRQVECDARCGRAEWSDSESYDQVRRTAVALGWRCDSTGDWCPDHRAVTGEQAQP